MVAPTVKIKRTATNDSPPAELLPGELAIEMGTPTRLWVGVPVALASARRKLLFDSSAVVTPGPGGNNVYVGESAPSGPTVGQLWYESDTGVFWLYYFDGNSSQWVQINAVAPPGGTLLTALTSEVKALSAEVDELKAEMRSKK